jgi:hypothetical protein
MFASRTAVDAAAITDRVSTRPDRPAVVSAIATKIGKFFDRLVTGSGQNLTGPDRRLSHEYLRFPPF